MDLDLAEFALNHALKLGAKYADVRLETTRTNEFILKNGIPQMAGFDRVQGMGIKINSGGCFGFVSTNELEKEKIKEVIEKAMKVTSAACRITEPAVMSEEPVETADYEVKQKVNLEDLSPKEKLNVLFDIEKSIASTKIDVPGRFFSMADFYTEKYFINSEGTKILSKIPRVDLWYFLTINDNGKTAQRYWQYGDAGGFDKITNRNFPELLKNEILKADENLKKGIKPPKDKIDIVVGPQVTGIMVHESVGHPYEADRILGREAAQAGETFIKQDMLNTRIGSNAVNIFDDPTIEESFGHYLYDDDGVKARKRHLMKNGIINEFLHNRNTAATMNTKSNGASRATGFDREAIVRMANTYVAPGEHSEEELIEGVKHGIFMKNFMEWNIDDKRLNAKYTGAESYIIENGKIGEPVFAPIIEISTPVLWGAVDATAKNMEYHSGTCGKAEPMQAIPVWFGGPSMRIRNITLGNKE
ncbi:TldD-like protein [Candidatus Woesearchaeota archaeon]|nr:TldD-like protein [Candidatus Woesearchaeota archaeon]|tara:strand:+ start:4338 stop:5759 length:1422 start_codon:yes stop_codon:yes gene_type:complete